MRRSTTDSAVGPGTRPVPFAGKFQRINPGASGVTVLEHMERLDEVERGLKKLGMEEVVVEEEEEEEDVGATTRDMASKNDPLDRNLGDAEPDHQAETSTSVSAPILSDYLSEDDAEPTAPPDTYETESVGKRAASDRGGRRSLDWTWSRERPDPDLKTRTVIVEVRMT